MKRVLSHVAAYVLCVLVISCLFPSISKAEGDPPILSSNLQHGNSRVYDGEETVMVRKMLAEYPPDDHSPGIGHGGPPRHL